MIKMAGIVRPAFRPGTLVTLCPGNAYCKMKISQLALSGRYVNSIINIEKGICRGGYYSI